MKTKQGSKEDALAYCFSQIKSSIVGPEDYNKLKQYMYRHKEGTLNEKGAKYLFDYFGIVEKCTYYIPVNKKS